MFLLLKDVYRCIYGWNYNQIFALNTSATTITGMNRKWGLRNNLEKGKEAQDQVTESAQVHFNA